ncbi:metallopeptidase TldD-related protein [Sphaerisporangium corydalis]|uniref:Metallopeptidase TldD-related protein n=1 Tax=Sphaerisporangium corydalis TaxID=1441875 RepID=A0ABV9EII0_9ACTN|nr:metallopeptidase TldD-related protein [Sphaerisporangium corydalis]
MTGPAWPDPAELRSAACGSPAEILIVTERGEQATWHTGGPTTTTGPTTTGGRTTTTGLTTRDGLTTTHTEMSHAICRAWHSRVAAETSAPWEGSAGLRPLVAMTARLASISGATGIPDPGQRDDPPEQRTWTTGAPVDAAPTPAEAAVRVAQAVADASGVLPRLVRAMAQTTTRCYVATDGRLLVQSTTRSWCTVTGGDPPGLTRAWVGASLTDLIGSIDRGDPLPGTLGDLSPGTSLNAAEITEGAGLSAWASAQLLEIITRQLTGRPEVLTGLLGGPDLIDPLKPNALDPSGRDAAGTQYLAPATRAFDDEGTLCRHATLISRGAAYDRVMDRRTAAAHGLRPLGHAFRPRPDDPLECRVRLPRWAGLPVETASRPRHHVIGISGASHGHTTGDSTLVATALVQRPDGTFHRHRLNAALPLLLSAITARSDTAEVLVPIRHGLALTSPIRIEPEPWGFPP